MVQRSRSASFQEVMISPPPSSAFRHTDHDNDNTNNDINNSTSRNMLEALNDNALSSSFSSTKSTADATRTGTTGGDNSSSDCGPSWRVVILLLIFLIANFTFGIICMTPLFTNIENDELVDNNLFTNYSLSSTLFDLFILTNLSIITSIIAIYKSYSSKTLHLQAHSKYTHINRFHPNNTPKSREEIEEEALEEQCCPNKFKRFICRYTFLSECIALLQGLLVIIKCLARLNVEIGVLDEGQSHHPLYWISLCISSIYCIVISFGLEYICVRMSAIGNYRRQRAVREQIGFSRRYYSNDDNNERRRMIGSSYRRRIGGDEEDDNVGDSVLDEPLLSSVMASPNDTNRIFNKTIDERNDMQNMNYIANNEGDHTGTDHHNDEDDDDEDDNGAFVATSDITADANYKAGWRDLLNLCYPDLHYFFFAFVFLILAAIAQVLIPRYTGNMLDAIATYAPNNDNSSDNKGHDHNIWKVPGFLLNMKKLIIASILGGVFSGIRGSIFTAVGARVNVRLRTMLMDSLLAQDMGFFDITKTGDITSRLSSDTTLVGDQVTLNVNVFLRSLVQAIGVLIFMTILSWQLTLLAFISVPAITILSRWYGEYIRSLTKLMQKKLADGNSISEAALGSMSTVRAFGAEYTEMEEFTKYMDQYKRLNVRNAIAYLGYATAVTSLPQLVTAVVLFYGGLLVMADGHDHITSGQLVSFLLYLSSLSDAFNSIGYIFASLTQAVGAADKVFELIHRKPKRKEPSTSDDETHVHASERGRKKIWNHIEQFRKAGVRPVACSGEVTLNKVMMYYPARPQRRILNDMTLYIPSGAVAALVGPSGGGKSSIVSLIQNLYEPRSGDIYIDGIKISDLCPDWVSKHLSVVSQEPTLFARSIKRNIIYGLEGTEDEPSMSDIREAARLANAHSFIESLPMKYETDVGERGVQLSGGQKQRIAIARALVRKPKILLLDEATSALDGESEAMVQEAIDKMISSDRSRTGMTVIIVAHRLSTVQNADTILVVDSGKIVESGSHNELIQNPDGAYANLISRQIKERGSKNMNDSLISHADDTSLASFPDS